MKLVSCAVAGSLFAMLVTSCTLPQGSTSTAGDSSLQAFLPQFEEGTSRFVNGDPTAWKQLVSHHDDATIMGGWGAFEKGWNEAGPRYDWAAARFRESGAKV